MRDEMEEYSSDDGDDIPDFGALLAEADREIAACGGQEDCPCGAVFERRIAHDRAVQDAREAYAVAQAGSDPLLATVLRTHLWYTRGACHEPVVRDGIAFYVVGRNASHEFFLGVRDGQRYVRSFCGEDGDDAEHIRAVPTWDGCYLGHA